MGGIACFSGVFLLLMVSDLVLVSESGEGAPPSLSLVGVSTLSEEPGACSLVLAAAASSLAFFLSFFL